MHNYLNTDKRTVSQLGGGANQVSPPPSLDSSMTMIVDTLYKLLSIKKNTKFSLALRA